MRIPLPRMMRQWREREFAQHLSPPAQRYGIRVWAFFAKRPGLYRMMAGTAARILKWMGPNGRIARLPFGGGWTGTRDFPASQGRSFQDLWRARGKKVS